MGLSRYRSPLATEAERRDGATYARWLIALRGRSGVYVIRDKKTREILYVGESHSGRLYGTLTRHFQWWTGLTAGTRYSRSSVTVAVEVTRPSRAPDRQYALIKRLDPRDNEVGRDDLEGPEETIDASEFQDG